MELPLYQCHKQVRAAKIVDFEYTATEVILVLDNGAKITVDGAWRSRNPKLALDGYFVEYQEGDKYTAYSPAGPFEGGYTIVGDGMGFGAAITALKAGKRVARTGWNGKGMWLVLIHPGNAMHTSSAGGFPMQPCIGMKTASGEMQPGWLASQTDMLAEDWQIVE